MQISLSYSSERKKNIFSKFFSLPYKQITPNFYESTISQKPSPDEYTCKTAKQKALSISSIYPKRNNFNKKVSRLYKINRTDC